MPYTFVATFFGIYLGIFENPHWEHSL